ncbi:hypothetical protein HYALB_00000239 [Hymenoscyphus albidus]|uniref:Uncharacterized protein n=1 Tax=Hymenoscyphus albidus TaxID=595503 RepID=A0A9N9LT69_9HELO|nr:hypothetical protein HYALB_00000239 [Hymenoscyphus albidus]
MKKNGVEFKLYVWSLIRASPHAHRIFRKYREHVLQFVIARDIGTILLPEALAALDSSELMMFESMDGEVLEIPIRGPWQGDVLSWMENWYLPEYKIMMRWGVEGYLDEHEKEIWNEWKDRHHFDKTDYLGADYLPPKENMLQLWQTHKDVMFIANLCVGETLDVFIRGFRGGDEPLGPKVSYTLEDISLVEKQRIFRAIYRFIIFGNVFAPSTENWVGMDPCAWFLCQFPAWKVEELSCVFDFVTDKILLKWQESEDHEFSRLSTDLDLWKLEGKMYFYSEDWKRRYFRRMQASSATLPIKDLRAILQSKKGLLKDLVEKVGDAGEREFLKEALEDDPGNKPVLFGGERLRKDAKCDKDHIPVSDGLSGNDSMSANKDYIWADGGYCRELYVSSTSSEPWRESLRRAGYVFWGSEIWGDNGTFIGREECGMRILKEFPRPAFEDQSLSVEERMKRCWQEKVNYS